MSTWSNIGKGIRNYIIDWLTFANDAWTKMHDWAIEWLKFWWELAWRAALWLWEWLMDTVDMAWDLVWHTVDVWAWLLGKDTNFGTTKWGIDMLWEQVDEWMKMMKDMIKTKTWDTAVWSKIADIAWIAWEIASPMWIINKWVKWIKIAKEAATALKKSPEAMSKIRSLMETAQKSGKAIEQSQVDEILQSYSIWTKWKVLENASRVAMKAPDKAQLIDLIKNSPDLAKTEMLKNWPKLQKVLSKVTPWSTVALLNQIDNLSDNDYEDFVQNIENDTNDKVVNINEVKKTEEDKVENTWDITLPPQDNLNPSKALNIDNKEPSVDSIEAKKKELELMKEKNAGTLNTSTSVVDLMKMLWAESTQEARKLIFEKTTGKPYTASAEDNMQLKSIIEEMFSKGKLPDYITPIKR